jgi:hypothetical protein
MKKQGHNWYIENDVIVKIFNIQKSMFGKQLYLNIGIKIKKLENNISSTFPGSHIGTRLDHLIEKDFLDFENSVQTSQRNEAFSKLLKSNPYNFFTLVGTDKELRDFISKNNILSVFKIAKDYLNIKE